MNIRERPTVVLISRVGSGKTTFYNKVCKENQKTQAGGVSCTRSLFQKSSNYGMGFYIMDTPGFGSDKAVIVHMGGIFAAITGKPLNNILILTKYDRLCNMRKDIADNIRFLDRYRDMITVVITHWDIAEKDPQKKNKLEQEKASILNEVVAYLGITNAIFSGSNTSGKQICQEIDQILISTIQKRVILTKTEFETQFADFITLDKNVEIKSLELESEFQAKCNAAIHFINQQDDQSNETAELMHELILTMKEEASATVEEFEQKHGYDCLKLLEQCGSYETAYLTHTKLKSKILNYLNDVMNRAQKKMTKYPAHIYNFIKQCPYCKLIWLKVSGCGGETTCGNFPDQDEQNFIPAAKQFKITITKQRINITRLKYNQQPSKKQFSNSSRSLKGCGKSIIWDNLPMLSEKVLQELYNIGALDYFNMQKSESATQNQDQDKFWNQIYKNSNIHLDDLINTQPSNLNHDKQPPPMITYEEKIQDSFDTKQIKKKKNQKVSCSECNIS